MTHYLWMIPFAMIVGFLVGAYLLAGDEDD